MRKLLLLVSAALVLSSPARAQFCPGMSPWVFDDVAASDPFCGYITWMAENGVSLGCQVIDANHRLYCPSDNVSRKQMAAFMNRLGNVRVEAVGTGPGLTGGPITSVGTINLATTQLLPTTACANNQIPRWNGSAWACGTDANGGGTVTSVGSGTGLTGGPITTTGTLSIATGYQLPQSCTNGQIPKSNGSNAWTCAADATGTGTVTSITAGAGLTGATITTSGTIAVDPASTTLTNNFFRQNGNAYGTTAVVGTTDNNPVEVRAFGARVMRYEPNTISPNVIGGSPANSVMAGVRGATIGGGGVPAGNTDPDFIGEAPNRVTDAYGTVGGGYANRAGDDSGTTVDRAFATVGGGYYNTASGTSSTIGGGYSNTASGPSNTVGGGYYNTTSGPTSTVGGGYVNNASGDGSTIGGGSLNTAGGSYATIPGGSQNVASGDFSFAAGRNAKALAQGCFVWADSINADFACNVADGFFVRPSGGMRIQGPGNWDVANTEGDVRIGNDDYRLKFGIALAGGGVGDAWVRAHGGIERFNIWAPGGTRVLTNAAGTTGVSIAAGAGTWSTLSDRSAKRDLTRVEGADVLERLVTMPVYRWRYLEERSGAPHMGPTAQDFREAFGLGENDKTIATVDADGVALAAIQGLNAKVEAQAREIVAQRDEIAGLREEVAAARALAADVAVLKAALAALQRERAEVAVR